MSPLPIGEDKLVSSMKSDTIYMWMPMIVKHLSFTKLYLAEKEDSTWILKR